MPPPLPPSPRALQLHHLLRRNFAHHASPTTFSSLPLHPSIISALSSLSLTHPTAIQERALTPILTHQTTLIAAETGAGKTLAYLIPLLSKLKETDLPSNQLLTQPANRPRLVVLVPTRQLAEQTFRVAKGLSHCGKFRARLVSGGMGGKSGKVRRRGLGAVDVVVGTPGSVGRMWGEGGLQLSRVGGVVVDEADVMMVEETGFAGQVGGILDGVGGCGKVQMVYAAASVSGGLRRGLERRHGGGGVVEVKGDRLHRVGGVGRVGSCFVRVAGGEEGKFGRVGEVVVEERGGGNGGVMVFCDGEERRGRLVEYLRGRWGVEVGLVGGAAGEGDWERFVGGEVKVVVCAASFGRGMDHAGVRVVVMVDVPMTGAEYLHRVGRVRGKGRVVVLVGERERAIAQALFLAHVNEEKVVGVEPRGAWEGYVGAGKDRIATSAAVRAARKKGWAQWEDERKSRAGVHERREDRGRVKKGKLKQSRNMVFTPSENRCQRLPNLS